MDRLALSANRWTSSSVRPWVSGRLVHTYPRVTASTTMKGKKQYGPKASCKIGKDTPTRKLHVQLTMQLIDMAVATNLKYSDGV